MPYEKSSPSSPEAQSASPIQDNLKALAALFPSVVRDGQVDVDALRQLCGEAVVKEDELFGLNWRGKAEARRAALTPSLGTLRPCKEESKNWDTTQNLYIEGDNLEVLKLLRKSYGGRVKMIYIDPPYNTGKEFVYPDDYQNGIENYKKLTGQEGKYAANVETSGRYHTTWLNMMYPRLILARDLLSEDGVIFISIDENEMVNLQKLCREIFGEQNYAGEIVWKNSSKNDEDYISIQHEYIVAYVKSKDSNIGDWSEKKEGTDEIFKAFEGFRKKHGNDWQAIHKDALHWYKQFPESNPISNSKHYSWMDERGIYFPADISGPNFGQYVYDVTHPTTGKICKAPASGWRFPEATMQERIAAGLVHFGIDETTVPNNKTYLKDTLYQSIASVKYKDGRVASKKLAALLGANIFNNPKDKGIIQGLISSCAKAEEAIILDFFSGSATTAHAVMKLNAEDGGNRRFIMVQLPESCEEKSEAYKAGYKNICEIGKERIRRAGEKVKEEAGLAGQRLDIGFRVYKLDSSNVKAWNPQEEDLVEAMSKYAEHLVGGRTEDDFLTEIMLKSGIDLVEDVQEREIAGHRVQSLGYGQYYACMSANMTTDEAEAVAIGIAAWHEEDCAFAGGEQQDTCTVFVSDRAFASNDAAKMNFVAILEQHGICNIKAL